MKRNFFQKMWDLLRYDIPNFFRNIWVFRGALRRNHWWDYSGTLEFFETAIDYMQRNVEKHGNEIEYSKRAKVAKMKRAVEILKRIREDQYFDIVEAEMGKSYEQIFGNDELERKYHDRIRELEESDWKELWLIIGGSTLRDGSDIRSWWD